MSAFDQADGGGDSLGPELHWIPLDNIHNVVVFYDADSYPDLKPNLTLRNCFLGFDPDKAPPFQVYVRDGAVAVLRLNLDGYVLIPRSHVHPLVTKPPE